MSGSENTPMPGKTSARQINDTIRYTMWSAFAADRLPAAADRGGLADEVDALFADLALKDVVVRGSYDVSGLRADADLLFWWHAPTVELVQTAYREVRRTELGRYLRPVWSGVALHRPAEFNKGHVPAFMSGEDARAYLCLYPFVRSYEWYLLPDDERRQMLVDHG